MKCIILAAGYATRLYPLTENFPKPLLPVAGRPILDHLLDDLAQSREIDRYIVVTNRRYAAHFAAWAENRPNVTVLDDGTLSNETRLGAVRDLQFAVDALHLDEDLLVMAGDNLTDFSLTCLLDYARQKRASCLMRYREPDAARLRRCGVVAVDGDDRIIRMVEKPQEPESEWCCPPFYVLMRQDVQRIPAAMEDGCGTDSPGMLMSWLAAHTAMYAMEMPGRRFDIGAIESYREVQRVFEAQMNGGET